MSAVANSWAKAIIDLNPLLNPSDRRALQALARAHTVKAGEASRSYAALAEATQDSLRTVKRSVARLEALGLIERAKQRKGQRQGANAYFLNMNVLRVSPCHPQRRSSECHSETPEVVSPCHPEKLSQSVTMTPPNARAHAGRESNASAVLSQAGMKDSLWDLYRVGRSARRDGGFDA